MDFIGFRLTKVVAVDCEMVEVDKWSEGLARLSERSVPQSPKRRRGTRKPMRNQSKQVINQF